MRARLAGRSAQTGFSLLEMVVALVILSISLAMLYQAAAGATRNVRVDERYAFAVQIAESLLADNPMVPMGGLQLGGEVDDFRWRLHSVPVGEDTGEAPAIRLQQLTAEVGWQDGENWREVTLVTVVPEWSGDAQG